MRDGAVHVGIVGVGNCASSLVQGLTYYRDASGNEPIAGLMHADLGGYLRREVRGIFHPTGTCAIGKVVDPGGAVLGIDGLVVADASIMPTIPRANTNLSTVAVAERIADWLGA